MKNVKGMLIYMFRTQKKTIISEKKVGEVYENMGEASFFLPFLNHHLACFRQASDQLSESCVPRHIK